MDIHQRSTFVLRLSHQRCWELWYKSLLSPCRCGKVTCLHHWCDHSTIILFICLSAGRRSACGRWDHTWTLSHTPEESLCCSPCDSHYCTRHTLPHSWQPAGCWFEEHISPPFFVFSSFCAINSDNCVWHKEKCSILDIQPTGCLFHLSCCMLVMMYEIVMHASATFCIVIYHNLVPQWTTKTQIHKIILSGWLFDRVFMVSSFKFELTTVE